MAQEPGLTVEVPDSVGSTGGIKDVLAGKADLARSVRPLRDAEKEQGLVEWVFAETPVVFAVHPSVTGVTGLTGAQALGVYAGKITDWAALGGPAGPISRVTREMPESSREVLNDVIPGFAVLGTEGQAVAYSTPEAVEMVRRHPGTIGYFSLTAMDRSLSPSVGAGECASNAAGSIAAKIPKGNRPAGKARIRPLSKARPMECTARSARPSSSASSISLTKSPLPPTLAKGTSRILSPLVLMGSRSTVRSGWASRNRSAT